MTKKQRDKLREQMLHDVVTYRECREYIIKCLDDLDEKDKRIEALKKPAKDRTHDIMLRLVRECQNCDCDDEDNPQVSQCCMCRARREIFHALFDENGVTPC